MGCQGGVLTTGHSVDIVVKDHHCQIDIASGTMDEMVTTDGRTVTIPRQHYNLQIWISHFYPGGKGNCAAVGCVQSVKVQITRSPGRTTDARDYNHFVRV